MADHCELSVRQVSESTGRLNDGASGMVKVGSWPDAEVHLLTGSDGNRCIAAVDRSETNPILHKTDRMVSVPGNQVLHNTARLQGAC